MASCQTLHGKELVTVYLLRTWLRENTENSLGQEYSGQTPTHCLAWLADSDETRHLYGEEKMREDEGRYITMRNRISTMSREGSSELSTLSSGRGGD